MRTDAPKFDGYAECIDEIEGVVHAAAACAKALYVLRAEGIPAPHLVRSPRTVDDLFPIWIVDASGNAIRISMQWWAVEGTVYLGLTPNGAVRALGAGPCHWPVVDGAVPPELVTTLKKWLGPSDE